MSTIALIVKLLPIVIQIIQDIEADAKIPTTIGKITAVKTQLEQAFPNETFIFEEVATLIDLLIPYLPSVAQVETEVKGCFPCRQSKK